MVVKILQSGIRNVEFGDNVKIVELVTLDSCIFRDNMLIGSFVEIQKNVIIGNNCEIKFYL